MAQPIKKAVFPAAGLGTRFLPATKAQPKEMLPIVDKPVIQYLVEEAVESGIEEIIIVTSPGKHAIESHFGPSPELEKMLAAKGKTEMLEEVHAISKLAKFTYVQQPEPLGDGHAILCAKEALGNEPFAVLFGDDIVDSETPAIQQLINVYNDTDRCIIGLHQIDKKDSASYGMVKPKSQDAPPSPLVDIESLVEKPPPEEAPSDLGIIGKYVCTPNIFAELEKAESGTTDGEIRLIDGFRSLIKEQSIYGYEIQGKRFDCGTKLGLIQATLNWGLKRDDLGPKLRAHL